MKTPVFCSLLFLPALAPAAIMLDGTKDVDYGAALAVQTVETGFGDNQSELNAAYGIVVGTNLHVMITGNLQNNFNKLNIFIDSQVGGQNVIGGTNAANDGWFSSYNGFTFDAGFDADYLLIARNGNSGGDRFDLDFTTIGTTTFESYGDVFSGTQTGISGALGTSGIQVAFNNSNAAGVSGGSAAADQIAALSVLTGIELIIPLISLGNPTGDIRISAMVNNGDHNYLSNQFLGGLPAPQVNLGGDGVGGFTGNVGGLDLNDFRGDQYFVVTVPEPSTALLSGLAFTVLFSRRRVRD